MTQVNATNSTNFNYVEIFNSSTVNFTTAVETKKYLFLSDENKKLYSIAKESTYKAMTTAGKFMGKIIDVVPTSYKTDFPSPGANSNLVAVIDTKGDSTSYSLMPLTLGNISIQCHPMTSLLCFWVSEETKKMEFLIKGVNDDYAHVPDIRFTFNIYNVYSYGRTGAVFWVLIFGYRDRKSVV